MMECALPTGSPSLWPLHWHGWGSFCSTLHSTVFSPSLLGPLSNNRIWGKTKKSLYNVCLQVFIIRLALEELLKWTLSHIYYIFNIMALFWPQTISFLSTEHIYIYPTCTYLNIYVHIHICVYMYVSKCLLLTYFKSVLRWKRVIF